MAVRPALPWYWRSLRVLALVGLLFSLVWAFFDGRQGGLARDLARLRDTIERQESELARLRAHAAQAQRQLQIERAAASDLAAQLKALTFENAALKEDLAFFHTLTAAPAGREGALSINRFRLQPQAVPGEYRYQMLLVQAGPRGRAFQGRLQFVLDVQHEGRKLVLVLPGDNERDAKDYRLDFRLFKRVEGSFKLAPGSVLKGLQVRIFENGSATPKLSQALNVS